MRKLCEEIERGRVRVGMFASSPEDGFNGAFELMVCGEELRIIASDGLGWDHVSVSKANSPNRVPNHEQLCEVKRLFWGDDVWVCHFYPPKADYVNNHAGCLHLWRCTAAEFPTPLALMVGIKGVTPEQMKKMKTETSRQLRRATGLLLSGSNPCGGGGKLTVI